MTFKDLAYFLSFFSTNGSTVLGNVSPFWLNLPYKIKQKNRYDHMHIIGTTGKGKSKLLEHMIYQDIVKGRGIALIDPHGDLADDVLYKPFKFAQFLSKTKVLLGLKTFH